MKRLGGFDMKKQLLTTCCATLLFVLVATPSVAEDEQARHFASSVELETKGKYQDALDSLLKVTDQRKNSYMYHLRKGWLLYLLGKYDDSITAYKAAIAKDSGSLEAKLGIIVPQLAARKWVDAERAALEVLKLDARSYLGLSRLAYAYYNLTRYSDAEKAYKRVVDLYPGDVDMRSGYAWALFKQGKYEAAKKEFKHILRFAPKHSASLQGIGLCP